MYQGSVFIQSRNLVENGGLIVAKARHIELAGGTGVVILRVYVCTQYYYTCFARIYKHTRTHMHT